MKTKIIVLVLIAIAFLNICSLSTASVGSATIVGNKVGLESQASYVDGRPKPSGTKPIITARGMQRTTFPGF